MKRSNLIATACFTAVMATLTLVNANAQWADAIEKSILTFSAPVELPGMTLPAGTYVFKRPDPNSNRIIQVFSEDEKNIHGMFLTVPTQRLEITDENVVTFRETAQGTPPAVRFWYYPSRQIGHEFVYPKDQALRIAARTGDTVLSTDAAVTADAAVSPVGGDVETQASADVAQQDAAVEPDAAVTQSADAAAAPAADVQAQATPEPMRQDGAVGTSGRADADAAELPSTASPLALSGLLGLLSLAGAATLRRFW